MDAPQSVPGLQLTATRHKPAFVKPFTPVEGPTVWYGKDLTVEVRITAHKVVSPASKGQLLRDQPL